MQVLMIQGAEETATSCSMVTILNAGHFVNLEQPEAFNKAARTFLDSL